MKSARIMKWHVGEWVVYKKQKVSSRPGPRAEVKYAAPHGEDYSYLVDKYWCVSAILDDERIEVATRTGKTHRIDPDDRNLRKPSLRERLFLRDRFPRIDVCKENIEHAG